MLFVASTNGAFFARSFRVKGAFETGNVIFIQAADLEVPGTNRCLDWRSMHFTPTYQGSDLLIQVLAGVVMKKAAGDSGQRNRGRRLLTSLMDADAIDIAVGEESITFIILNDEGIAYVLRVGLEAQ